MTVLETFRLIAEEFAAVTDDTVTTAIEFVSNELSESKFGSDYIKAHAYLTAHWFAWKAIIVAGGSTSGAATGGKVISEKEGDLSRSYSDSSGSSSSTSYTDNLERTTYGLEYRRLARKHIVPILTRMG